MLEGELTPVTIGPDVRMFDQHDVAVLGIVENMSGFVCRDCGSAHDVFDEGGGETLAAEFEYPLLAEIPLDSDVRAAGEVGEPVVTRSDSSTAGAFEELGAAVMDAIGTMRRKSHATVAIGTDGSASSAESEPSSSKDGVSPSQRPDANAPHGE